MKKWNSPVLWIVLNLGCAVHSLWLLSQEWDDYRFFMMMLNGSMAFWIYWKFYGRFER